MASRMVGLLYAGRDVEEAKEAEISEGDAAEINNR